MTLSKSGTHVPGRLMWVEMWCKQCGLMFSFFDDGGPFVIWAFQGSVGKLMDIWCSEFRGWIHFRCSHWPIIKVLESVTMVGSRAKFNLLSWCCLIICCWFFFLIWRYLETLYDYTTHHTHTHTHAHTFGDIYTYINKYIYIYTHLSHIYHIYIYLYVHMLR